MKINRLVLNTCSFISFCFMSLSDGFAKGFADPAGDIALQQRNIIILAFALMALIVVPLFVLIVRYAIKYRATAQHKEYDPEWSHSAKIEVIVWGAPLLIIIVLGAVTWVTTHRLDPYRPLDRFSVTKPREGVDFSEPLEIQAIGMDWKWLFIYPKEGIAVVNEMALPVDRPIRFYLTASSMMTSFYVPALSGQIYAMPGMRTELNAILYRTGQFEGFNSNYSGNGFSGMHFKVYGYTNAAFREWVQKVGSSSKSLNEVEYRQLDHPSENVPVMYFSKTSHKLFHKIVNLCVYPDSMCMDDMMHIDMLGGTKNADLDAYRRLSYDSRFTEDLTTTERNAP